MRRLVAALLLVPGIAAADLDLSPGQRAAFGAEVRALLLAEPGIVARALRREVPPPVASGYADDIDSDLALIARHRAALFDAPADLNLGDPGSAPWLVAFVDSDAPAGQDTLTMLRDLAATHPGIAVRNLDMGQLASGSTRTALMAQDLGLDTLPFFVTANAMIRGDVPAIALIRAFDRAQ